MITSYLTYLHTNLYLPMPKIVSDSRPSATTTDYLFLNPPVQGGGGGGGGVKQIYPGHDAL